MRNETDYSNNRCDVFGVVGEKIKVNNFHSLQPERLYWAAWMSQNTNIVDVCWEQEKKIYLNTTYPIVNT